ncbi:hypothetical protein NLX86_07425 [Streptomyces sp. A3M-1-3]|uniref:hypothetical protein n=1 Tax=Streptomyces sp. A3M-1-3 TaxID=2962044 RepID=UPI0020B80894|nr:hypothetical protein [Streptomyces sp. A3M-1-3]MCP3817966.1 hypothetical protein [Streptomyces sp. A3M-1-3]
MAQRAVIRGAVAAAVSLSLAAALGPAAAQAAPTAAGAVANAADPVEIPATFAKAQQQFHLDHTGSRLEADGAGRQGVFHRKSAGQYEWARYADGRSVPVEPAGTGVVTAMHGTGTDTMAFRRGNDANCATWLPGRRGS